MVEEDRGSKESSAFNLFIFILIPALSLLMASSLVLTFIFSGFFILSIQIREIISLGIKQLNGINYFHFTTVITVILFENQFYSFIQSIDGESIIITHIMTIIQYSYIIMQEYTKIIGKLQELQITLSDPTKQYYLLCGSHKSGKNTLIHYLLDLQLEFGIDDEGQDVLSIIDEQNKTVVIQDILELYHFDSQDELRYICFNQFPDENMNADQRIVWGLTLQWILQLLKDSKLRIIFTLSLQEDLPSLIESYQKYFGHITNFAQKTTIILTKIIDEDEYHEFVGKSVDEIVQMNPKLEFLNEIIKNDSVHCFFTRDVDPDQRQQLFDKVSVKDNNQQELNIQLQSSILSQYFNEGHNQWALYAKQQLKVIYQFIDSILIHILSSQAAITLNQSIQEKMSILGNKLFYKQYSYSLEKLDENLNRQEFFKIYENLAKILRTEPQQFLRRLRQQLKGICLFNLDQIYKNLNATTSLMEGLHETLSLTVDIDLQQFQKMFQESSFSDVTIQKIVPKLKGNFSNQFLKEFEEKTKKIETKEKKRKMKTIKKLYPDYEDQKKSFKGSIKEKFALPTSPLKFQFLLDELESATKDKKRNILKQKILIKCLINILEFYEQYLEATQLAMMVPDYNSLEVELQAFIIKNKQEKLPKDVIANIQEIIQFCLGNYRRYVVNQAIQFVQEQRQLPENQKQELQEKYKDIEQQGFKKECDGKNFMNLEKLKKITAVKKVIVEKMIDEEYRNWKKIERDLCLQQILKGDLLKNLN